MMPAWPATGALGIALFALSCIAGAEPSSPGVAYAAPLVITSGGTYSGNWETTNAATFAVDVRTTQPVVLENCNVRGKSDPLVRAVAHAHVTIRSCSAYGALPGIATRPRGHLLNGVFAYADVENNYLEHTSGIQIAGGLRPTVADTTATIRVLRNRVKDIDGRLPAGSPCPGQVQSATSGFYCHVHFVGLLGVRSDPNVEIAWNEVINEPGESAMEDVILVTSSSGLPTAPIDIHDNYVQGAGPPDPAKNEKWGGSGINGGDDLVLDPSGPHRRDPAFVSAYVHVHDNQVVGGANWAFCVVAAHDVIVERNRAVHSGLLLDGRAIATNTHAVVFYDIYGLNAGGPVVTANTARNNAVGYTFPFSGSVTGLQRSDFDWYGKICNKQNADACCADAAKAGNLDASLCMPNTDLYFETPNSAVTTANETYEYESVWLGKLSTNNIRLGPS
jgi:hypothetical protein